MQRAAARALDSYSVTTKTEPAVAGPLYLDDQKESDRFLSALGQVPRIAVDTEGASFHRFVDRIYLLQLSTDSRHAIIDPLRVTTLEGLGKLLESREVEVVFHDADYDVRLLHQDYGWRITSIFDTRVAAQLLGVKQFGLAALLQKHFGTKLDKKHQRADWSMRPLTGDMLAYAAQDTMQLLQLRDELANDLETKGRSHWAREEFERLEGTRWTVDAPGTSFLRTKGARDLTRRELAILRELVEWRDGVAGTLDRATFRVVSNDVLLELCRKVPKHAGQLQGMKGLNPRMASEQGAAIIAAVERGMAVPENELPRFPRSPRWEKDPQLDQRLSQLKSVRDAAAQRLELDPGVLCARDRMEAVARRQPASLDDFNELPELRKWQVEVLGEDFIKAMRKGGGGGGGGGTASKVAPPSPKPAPSAPAPRRNNDSPYSDG